MPSLTIREQCIEAIMAVVGTMQTVAPDPVGPLWNKIQRGNLLGMSAIELPAIGVEEGDEQQIYRDEWVVHKRLMLMFHFQFQQQSDRDLWELASYYVGRLEEYIPTIQLTVPGFVCVGEESSAPMIEGRSDPRPGGYVSISLDYRHKNRDPYSYL